MRQFVLALQNFDSAKRQFRPTNTKPGTANNSWAPFVMLSATCSVRFLGNQTGLRLLAQLDVRAGGETVDASGL